jgi:hypothetical protein
MRLDRQQLLLLVLAVVAGIVIGRASAPTSFAGPGARSAATADVAADLAADGAPGVDRSMLTSGEPSPEMIAAMRRQALTAQRAYAAAVAPMRALSLMRMHLRETMTAEEAYMAENGAYTGDFSRLALMERGDSVTVSIRWAGPTAWVAEATHPAFPGGSCVVAGGAVEAVAEEVATRRDGLRSEATFHIACDSVSAR